MILLYKIGELLFDNSYQALMPVIAYGLYESLLLLARCFFAFGVLYIIFGDQKKNQRSHTLQYCNGRKPSSGSDYVSNGFSKIVF